MTARLLVFLLGCLLPLSSWAACFSPDIETLAATMAEELHAALPVPLDRQTAITLLPFTDTKNHQDSELGRIIVSSIGEHFFRYGYRIEPMPHPTPSPAFPVHPDAGQSTLHASRREAPILLSGTLTQGRHFLLVLAHVVDTVNRTILSSAQCRLRLTPELLELPTRDHPATHAPSPRLRSLQAKDDVREIQHALHALGLYAHRVDGLWGPHSKAALAQFALRHGLAADTAWNPEMQRLLLPDLPMTP